MNYGQTDFRFIKNSALKAELFDWPFWVASQNISNKKQYKFRKILL